MSGVFSQFAQLFPVSTGKFLLQLVFVAKKILAKAEPSVSISPHARFSGAEIAG